MAQREAACYATPSQRLAEAGQALSSGEEATLQALLRQKEELTRERDEQVCGAPMTHTPRGLSKPA